MARSMPAGRRRLPGATHRPHRPRNVLDALLPHVLERKGELVAYLIANHPADADPAWLGQGFEPCRDIHTVAENALALGDHVAQVDTDAELDPLLGRDALILLGHAALDLDGAPNGIDHARKLGKEAVAGVFYDTAAVFADLRIDQLLEVGFEPLVGAFLVRSHQPRVPAHISGEDRGETADSGHFSPGGRLSRPSLPRNPYRPYRSVGRAASGATSTGRADHQSRRLFGDRKCRCFSGALCPLHATASPPLPCVFSGE